MLERGSIDKHLTFDVGLIQLSFIPVCSPIIFITIHATFQSNCAEGLHFSAFHVYFIKHNTWQNHFYDSRAMPARSVDTTLEARLDYAPL